jgi:hypothetical protein|tara:strand:+ start:792 stop:1964 length:1173 start_codon:yes stop_codon:yes gene_type:complete
MRNIIFTFLFFLSTTLVGQTEDYTVSILTIGPGNSLNDSFGHSAIRVQSKTKKYDLVFNYGIYDYNDPRFYSNFIKGYLKYSLGVSYFENFKSSYIANDRYIKEQVLSLPNDLKEKLVDKLIFNSKPENKDYFYDYFNNNCSTVIKDIIKGLLSQYDYHNTYESVTSNKDSYRSLIYENINKNSWGSLGIDICLGSYIDQQIDSEKNTFLPEYLFEYLNSSYYSYSNNDKKIEKVKLIENIIFINKVKDVEKSTFNIFLTSPLFIFLLIFTALFLLNYRNKKNKKIHLALESIHILTSFIGCLLLFLWFFTDHTTAAFNYNLLWANPINFILLINVLNKKWKIAYLKLLLLSLILIVLHSITGVQVFNISLYPLFLFLAFRYLQLIKFYS